MKTQFKEDEMKKISHNVSAPENASERPVYPTQYSLFSDIRRNGMS